MVCRINYEERLECERLETHTRSRYQLTQSVVNSRPGFVYDPDVIKPSTPEIFGLTRAGGNGGSFDDVSRALLSSFLLLSLFVCWAK